MKICAKCQGEGWIEGLGDCHACHGTGSIAGKAKVFAPRARAFRQPPRHPEGNPFFDELHRDVLERDRAENLFRHGSYLL